MQIRRLGWAGLELELDGASLVIDLFEDPAPLVPFTGDVHTPLPPPQTGGRVAAALVTHLHADHADGPAIARALAGDGQVLRPAPSDGAGLEVAALAGAEATLSGLDARVMAPWDRATVGPFAVTAVPAVDGFGDPQVSWVVEGGGRRMFHGGDTVLHGWWWNIASRCGPIDVAFLPVNGAVCDFPHRQPPSPLNACLDPRQAAVAASLLRAAEAVPIHYDAIHRPPVYAQVDAPAQAFVAEAGRLGVSAREVAIGAVV